MSRYNVNIRILREYIFVLLTLCSIPNAFSSNAIIAPLEPIVDGSWTSQGKEMTHWAETFLRKELDTSVSIESVRTKRIPFYSTASKNVVLVEAREMNNSAAYYLIKDDGNDFVVLLDGNGASVHKINKLISFSINTSEIVVPYLKFFASSIACFRVGNPPSFSDLPVFISETTQLPFSSLYIKVSTPSTIFTGSPFTSTIPSSLIILYVFLPTSGVTFTVGCMVG